jgi:spectinomycin phosphotransferase
VIEKPSLSDEKIIAALGDSYQIPVTAVEFLQLGNDTHAWVYKVQVDGGKASFLKVRKGQINEPSLTVPRYLSDHGIGQAVVPLANRAGRLWTVVEPFALILYPFIDGGMGAVVGMSDAQWLELGAVVRKMHDLPLEAAFTKHMRRETFVSAWMDVVQSFQADITHRPCKDDTEKDFISIWSEKRTVIQKIINRALQLGRLLQGQSLKFGLCHADIHTYNVLIDHAGKLFIVDWDETIIAPKERDLMFVGGGINDPANRAKEVELFYQGYGTAEVNPVAVAYYCYEWVVQELGSYAERVFLADDLGEDTRKEAVDYFRGLFQPRDVVEVAYQTDANLPPDIKARLV